MARTTSFDGRFEDMPLSVQRALSADRSYYDQAACRQRIDGTPKIAWLAEPKRRYKAGGQTYTGERLIELALLGCSMCPVQWECATTALDADERAGIWGDTLDRLATVRLAPVNHVTFFEMAKSTGVTVQRSIDLLASRHIT